MTKTMEAKIAAGNPGQRSIEVDTSIHIDLPDQIPDPPSWLSDLAFAEWESIVDIFRDQKLLKACDANALGIYCESVARLQEAEIAIQREGMVVEGRDGPRISPYVRIAENERKNILAFMKEFGFTPLARSRVLTGKRADKNEKRNRISKLTIVGTKRKDVEE